MKNAGTVVIADDVTANVGLLERLLLREGYVVYPATDGEAALELVVRPIVRHHHERLDGSGYPDKLRGDAIPLLAQIMGIVDVYDALTTPRVYRSAVPWEAASVELHEEANRGWRSARLVSEFLTISCGGRLEKLAETHPGPSALAFR